MSKIALQETIDAAVEMLQNVDRNDTDAMFDTLVELEMLARDAVADHSVGELLNAGIATAQGDLDLGAAA